MRRPTNWFSSSLLSLFTLFSLSLARDRITRTQSLVDGQTLVSPLGIFELGFFSPGNSKNRYVGIWYKQIPAQTVVWVANRDNPLTNRNGVLRIGLAAELVLVDGSGRVAWSSEPSNTPYPVAQLLDSGNFVVRSETDTVYLWESFNSPSDTWLPGMKFSSRFELGLVSWRDSEDASLGDYSVKLDIQGLPQLFLRGRSDTLYRTGPWNGLRLSGTPEMKSYNMFNYNFISTENESYYEHELNDPDIVTRLVLGRSGTLQRFIWVNRTRSWNVYWSAPKDQCDVYRSCGAFGVCNTNESPVCRCLSGFEPREVGEWTRGEWGGGCVRRRSLGCGEGDGFVKVAGLKLPDTANSVVNRSMGIGECRERCLRRCSCVAYSSANISGDGSGCVMWVDELMDLREFSDGGQDLYVRVASSELDEIEYGQSNGSIDKKKLGIILGTLVSLSLLLINACLCLLWRKKQEDRVVTEQSENLPLYNSGPSITALDIFMDGKMLSDDENKSAELSLFSFASISAATDNFSAMNKLGEGGFGPVHKGKFSNGHEVAVKRLSNSSGQGFEEFKNEVMLIARLQHMNLVRLLGICIQGEEKMLIYEYMPNNSLDSFIFDPTKGASLDWCKRMRIIEGIAQGILYLHKYSRLRVIHRDLKASNILLDAELNPKISDFGMARIFGGDQNQGNTKRVVGTYGYMPPEYALRGIFSEKSDVFSFGVLLLEIVSGKKNAGFHRIDDSLNLLDHAWHLWEDGKPLELADPTLRDSGPNEELLRCIHVGLLCVQERAEDRPTMSAVVSFLGSNSASMPCLKQPAFATRKGQVTMDLDSNRAGSGSSNEVTISLIEAR